MVSGSSGFGGFWVCGVVGGVGSTGFGGFELWGCRGLEVLGFECLVGFGGPGRGFGEFVFFEMFWSFEDLGLAALRRVASVRGGVCFRAHPKP